MDRTFITRSIQLRGHRARRGRGLRTKERLSQESLNSRTREYILVGRLGQLFFAQAGISWCCADDFRQDMRFTG